MRELFNKKDAFKQKTNAEKSDIEQKATFDNDEVTENLLNSKSEAKSIHNRNEFENINNTGKNDNENLAAGTIEEKKARTGRKRRHSGCLSVIFSLTIQQVLIVLFIVLFLFILSNALNLIVSLLPPSLYYQVKGIEAYKINSEGKEVYVDEATYSVYNYLSDFADAVDKDKTSRDEMMKKLPSLISSIRETRGKIPKDTSDSLSIVQREALKRIEASAGGILAFADRNNLNALDPDVKEELIALYPENSELTDEILDRLNKANVDNVDRALELKDKLIEYYK